MPSDIDTSIKLKIHEFGAADVREAFARSKQENLQLILVDAKYRALSEKGWNKVLNATTDKWKKYRPEFFDCDDFARCQAALVSLHFDINGCGQVYDISGQHSYNVILVSGGSSLETRIVEPQAGSILPKSMVGQGHYPETSGFVVI